VIAAGVSAAASSAESALLVVIGGMTIGGAANPADLDGDGEVNGADLGVLLSACGGGESDAVVRT